MEFLLVKNESTGDESLRRVVSVDHFSLVFDVSERLCDDMGNPYVFTVNVMTNDEKKQYLFAKMKNVIEKMVDEYNNMCDTKVALDINKLLFVFNTK